MCAIVALCASGAHAQSEPAHERAGEPAGCDPACCADRLRDARQAAPSGEEAWLAAAREVSGCGEVERLLYDAAFQFEGARLLGPAIAAWQALVRSVPASELAPRALYRLAANYEALAIYDAAASWYERLAREHPRDERAPEALENAVFLRMGLGQHDAAVDAARLFERNYQRRMPRETARLVFSLGAIHDRAEDWSRVVDHYQSWLRTHRRNGMPHEVIRANVQMGRARWELGDRARARPSFEAAAREWPNAERRIEGLAELSDGDRALAVARAREATAEALHFLARYEEIAFEAVRPPAFTGGPTAERVERWAAGPFRSWLEAKREALTRAEEAFGRVAESEIPQWSIAAALRVGEMYRHFIEGLERSLAIVPSSGPLEASLSGDARARLLTPLVSVARDRFEHCAGLATRVRWFSAESQACMDRLAELSARTSSDPSAAPTSPWIRGEELLFPWLAVGGPVAPPPVRSDVEPPAPGQAPPPDPRRAIDPLEGLHAAVLAPVIGSRVRGRARPP